MSFPTDDANRRTDESGDPTVVHRGFDWSDTDPIEAIVETLTAATGVSATEIDPLQYSVDYDALDRLVRSSTDRRVAVSFPHGDRVVTVTGAGDVYCAES
ncbi:HalOD1 output domain-containing protein [Halobaculum marinum]|uniref:HalOD1 output domain-containing protein n=1 Tax=Halobaculum marinum TaxID=3031996 RepID=A0ABD5WY65_9EURY|nr:HalOD1 output domain-containing protein [Halobaculum sp. DT55]